MKKIMKRYVIQMKSHFESTEMWYLCKGYPRKYKFGNRIARVPDIERARKFKTREAAEDFIREFSPVLLSGAENYIIETKI